METMEDYTKELEASFRSVKAVEEEASAEEDGAGAEEYSSHEETATSLGGLLRKLKL